MLPWIGRDLKFSGKLGAELTVEQGYSAFQLSALNGLSLLESIVGELSAIKRIHRLEGTGGATADFFDMPIALNGASHLINGVFGVKGAHTRMIYSKCIHTFLIIFGQSMVQAERVIIYPMVRILA